MVNRDKSLQVSFHLHTSSTLHETAKWDVGQLGAQTKVRGGHKDTVRGDKESDLGWMRNDTHFSVPHHFPGER